MATNINALVFDKAKYDKEYHSRPENKEKARVRATKFYHEVYRDWALEEAKRRYQEQKDDPEYKAKRKAIKAKSRAKHLVDVRAGARDYYYRNIEREHAKKRNGISFLGKWVHLGFNPRRGICSQCGYEGFTAIHHIMYDPDNPAAYTIELCVKCHKAEPNGPLLLA